MLGLEQHEQNVSSIQNDLNILKSETLSKAEKQQKATEIRQKAETEKVSIEKKINELKDKTDEESIAEKEKAEVLLKTLTDIVEVQLSVLTQQSSSETSQEASALLAEVGSATSTAEVKNGSESDEKKGVGEWLKEHWKGVSLGALGLGGLLLWRKKKKLDDEENDEEENDEDEDGEESDSKKSSKKRKKKKKGKSWFKKFLIGAGIITGTAIGGVEIYKHWNKIKSWVKDLLGLNLSFEEAKAKVEAEVRNGINSDNKFGTFYANFEGIDYKESTQIVSSYGEETKIDYKNKKIESLDVEFPDREQLLHAANLVNFAKRKLKGRGANATPFTINQRGDISFGLAGEGQTDFISGSDSNLWKLILGGTGVVGGGLLGGYCAGIKGAAIGALTGGATGYIGGAILDENSSLRKMCDTIKKGTNLSLFVNYLNSQKDKDGKSLRESHDQTVENENINPLQTYLNEIITDIENSYGNGEEDSSRRNLKIEFNENHPETFIVSSYNQTVQLTLEGCETKQGDIGIEFDKIKKIHIEKYKDNDWGDGLDIDFPHDKDGLKEAIRTINLTNKIREDRSYKGGEDFPFAYGRYKTPFGLDMDTKGLGENYMGGVNIVSHSTLEDKFPTIADDLEKYNTVSGFLSNEQSERYDEAKNDKLEGSQYIKYLHQMTELNGQKGYWKKLD